MAANLKGYDMGTPTVTSIVTVATPGSGKTLRVYQIDFSVSAQMSVLFEDNAAGTGNFLARSPILAAGAKHVIDFGPEGVLLSAVNNVLKATGSAAGTITGWVKGRDE